MAGAPSPQRPANAGKAAHAEPAQDPQQLMAQMEILQREMERMDRRMASLEQALMEAQQAASTLEALAAEKGEVQALVPLGGGVHAMARLDAKSAVLLPVGAGYLTEATPEQVAQALQQRVEALTKQFQKANEEVSRLAQAGAALNTELESMSTA